MALDEPTTWPALESAPRHQHGKHVAVVVPAAVPGRLPIHLGTAAELAGAPDERAFQQAVIVQILQQHGQPLVQLRTLPAHGLEVVLVRVPAGRVIDDDVRHARLDQPPGNEAFLPERVPPVAIPQFRLLLGEVEYVFALAQDQLVGGVLGFLGGGDLRVGLRQDLAQGVQLVATGCGGPADVRR